MKVFKGMLYGAFFSLIIVVLVFVLVGCGTDDKGNQQAETAAESTVSAPMTLEGIWIAPGPGNCVFFLDIGKTTYKDGAICGDDTHRIELYHVISYEVSENSIYGTIQTSECSPELVGDKVVKPFAREGNNLTTESRQWVLATKIPPAVFTCP